MSLGNGNLSHSQFTIGAQEGTVGPVMGKAGWGKNPEVFRREWGHMDMCVSKAVFSFFINRNLAYISLGAWLRGDDRWTFSLCWLTAGFWVFKTKGLWKMSAALCNLAEESLPAPSRWLSHSPTFSSSFSLSLCTPPRISLHLNLTRLLPFANKNLEFGVFF